MTRPRPLTPSLLAASLSLLLYQAPALAQQADTSADPQQAPAEAAPAEATPAQDTDTSTDPGEASDATNLDAVTVTGYRYSIEKSLDQKRNANAVVEVVTAEDVSKFPDKNVADALQRTPGVIIERDGGEGKRVSVRGLASDLTMTQLNGNYVATAEANGDPTRSFNYTLLPANMLSSAELYKTPEARIDEGGIGGTVIVRTRRPLDLESNTGFASIEGTYGDTTEKTDTQASGMYSWHTDDDRFGFLVGMTSQTRTNRTMSANIESWRWWTDDQDAQPATDVSGRPYDSTDIAYWWGSGVDDQAGNHYSGYWAPQSVNFNVRDEERKRKGAQATLQFKPTDNLLVTANYFRFELEGNYTNNILKIPEWGYSENFADDQGRLLAPNGLTFDPSGTILTGARFEVPEGGCSLLVNPVTGEPRDRPCAMETPQLSGTYSREEALSQTADFEVEYRGEAFNASFKAGRTWAEGGPSMLFGMSAKPRKLNPATNMYENGNFLSAWDLTGTPSMVFSPELQQSLMNGNAEIDIGSTGSSWTRNDIEQRFYQTDFTWMFASGFLESLQFGAKYRDGSAHRSTGNTYWVCPGLEPVYENRYQNCDPVAGGAQAGFFQSEPIGNLHGVYDISDFVAIDYPAYLQYLNDRFGSPHRREEDNFVYNVDEEIWSGYIQANFRTERLRGNLGVRVARTKQQIDTTDRVVYNLDAHPDDANGNPVACPPEGVYQGINCTPGDEVYLPDDLAREETWLLSEQSKTFTDVLPSFNIAYDLTENLVLRGAASKVIARTGYGDLGQLGDLSYNTQEYCDDRCRFGARPEGWYGSGGNKNLDPYEATQYDIGLEWYFHPGSVAGIGLFRKDVKNFIVSVVRDQEIVLDGETITVTDFSTRANGRDGISEGVELYLQHTFDWGFGFQANYTMNRTNLASIELDGEKIGESPLVGSARNQGNLTLFYENEKFLARASYNRRGRVVRGFVSGLNAYSEPYEQLDLNVGYNITDQLSVTGSVLNATKSEQRTHLGNDTDDRFLDGSYSGRQYYMGVTYKF